MKKAKNKLSEKFSRTFLQACFLTILLGLVSACGNSSIGRNNSGATDVSNIPQLTEFEKDLKSLRTAEFEFIYVFRRKDGGAFDEDDKNFLRENRPLEINRFILSDAEKAFLVGSNFAFPEENLKEIRGRFEVEDLSPPKKEEETSPETEGNHPEKGEAKRETEADKQADEHLKPKTQNRKPKTENRPN